MAANPDIEAPSFSYGEATALSVLVANQPSVNLGISGYCSLSHHPGSNSGLIVVLAARLLTRSCNSGVTEA